MFPDGVKVRLPLFDVTKALMMLWVIWGHLGLYGIVGIPAGDYPHLLNAKIGVNMPVFFAISGYFAASTFAKGVWSKVAARAVGFLWPQTALAACVAATGLLLKMDLGETVEYLLSIWFLRTMLVVYVLAALAYRPKEELDEYYEAWARIGVVCCTGDYQDIFLESRVMLTDSASFLPEYAATGRPLIHLWCDENKETPPETSLRLMDTFYRVSTPEKLEKTLKLVVEERRDPKREERIRVVKELGLCDNDAAKNMVAYFKDLLGR